MDGLAGNAEKCLPSAAAVGEGEGGRSREKVGDRRKTNSDQQDLEHGQAIRQTGRWRLTKRARLPGGLAHAAERAGAKQVRWERLRTGRSRDLSGSREDEGIAVAGKAETAVVVLNRFGGLVGAAGDGLRFGMAPMAGADDAKPDGSQAFGKDDAAKEGEEEGRNEASRHKPTIRQVGGTINGTVSRRDGLGCISV